MAAETEQQTVYIVVCEQHYASNYRVIAVCDSLEKAQEIKAQGPDREIYTARMNEEVLT